MWGGVLITAKVLADVVHGKKLEREAEEGGREGPCSKALLSKRAIRRRSSGSSDQSAEIRGLRKPSYLHARQKESKNDTKRKYRARWKPGPKRKRESDEPSEQGI